MDGDRRVVPGYYTHVVTDYAVVDAMLAMAQVRPDDFVVDLGSGDGRILIAAARSHGARGLGVDIDPARIRESTANALAAGVAHLNTYDYINTTLPAGELVPTAPKTNFAWAWMVGVSFNVTPNWAFDIGYRNLHLGDAISGTESTSAITRFRGLGAQEIRVGFRLILD